VMFLPSCRVPSAHAPSFTLHFTPFLQNQILFKASLGSLRSRSRFLVRAGFWSCPFGRFLQMTVRRVIQKQGDKMTPQATFPSLCFTSSLSCSMCRSETAGAFFCEDEGRSSHPPFAPEVENYARSFPFLARKHSVLRNCEVTGPRCFKMRS